MQKDTDSLKINLLKKFEEYLASEELKLTWISSSLFGDFYFVSTKSDSPELVLLDFYEGEKGQAFTITIERDMENTPLSVKKFITSYIDDIKVLRKDRERIFQIQTIYGYG
jgi:hypothetical protein